MKKYVTPDMVAEARQVDLLTYLKRFEPQELVQLSDDTYCTRSHDSLKISNGAWMWWSRGFGGYTALDYLVKVRGMAFVDAVERICNERARLPPESFINKSKPKPKEKKPLLLPERAPSNIVAIHYLCSRGIDKWIARECAERGLLYESSPYHNVIFVGLDKDHVPRYAGYRATNGERILGDCSGSDKHFSFRLVGAESNAVHLFESAIDLLSYATFLKMKGADYHDYNLISLAGIYAPSHEQGKGHIPAVLQSYLDERPDTQRVFVHFDNDDKGRAASKVIVSKLSQRYEVYDSPPPYGKDYNDYLQLYQQRRYKTLYERNDARA